MFATEGVLIIKSLIRWVNLVQTLIYSHPPLLKTRVERYKSQGPSVYFLIKHRASKLLGIHRVCRNLLNILKQYYTQILSTVISNTHCLEAWVMPLKIVYLFESSVGQRGFRAATTHSKGDPVSYPSTFYLYAQWVPYNFFAKNGWPQVASECNEVIYTMCVCVCVAILLLSRSQENCD